MKKSAMMILLSAALAIPTMAAKLEGTTTLKDFQPAGVADKHAKKSKHQVYDVTFDTGGKEYVCRTDGDKSTNAVNFVVGSSVSYEIDGQKAKIKTPEKKSLECRIVRVSVAPSATQ